MKPVIKCSDCNDEQKCLRHHEYDSSEYITLAPGPKEKRAISLEEENKVLLEALGYCGIAQKLMTAEDGVRALVPERLAEQIDFKKIEAILFKQLEQREPRFKCEICGGDITSSDYPGNAVERYAGSSLRMLGVIMTFRIDREWIICGKCGDKIHEKLQQGEDK